MTSLPRPPRADPDTIGNAPLVADGGAESALEALYRQIGELADALAESEAENDRLKGEQTVEKVKAKLLEPYVTGVFRFVVGYCVVVGCLLLMAGFPWFGFALPETILAIIAGSTAVSVIGLIGLVVSGLFGKSGGG